MVVSECLIPTSFIYMNWSKRGLKSILKPKYNLAKNTIFISRINTSRVANIFELPIDSEEDLVTSRILWLDGLEIGANKGPGIDSFQRYIYIHGTQEEGLIGQKASHGCIRMFNSDVVYLYELVEKGTKVHIKA